MSTRSFDFFCIPQELSKVLAEALEGSADVSLFIEREGGGRPLARADLGEFILNRPKVLWADAGGGEPTSFLGLVRIRPPFYEANVLCMSSFAIKAEGDIERSKANLRLYDRLTRGMRSRLKAGLWGVNTKTGGERFYRDLRISAGAIDEFRAGRELAPEAGDGFVRFEYREGEASDVKAD